MIQKIKKTDKFPQEAEIGTLMLLYTKDLFVYDGTKWVMVGGQYLPDLARKRVLDYLEDGWELPDILKFDLLNYLDTSDFWQKNMYNRLLDISHKIDSKLNGNLI